MKTQELLKKRAAIIASMQALTDKADTEQRDFTPAEEKEFEEREAEAQGLTKRIAREETLAAMAGEATRSSARYEPADDTRTAQKAQGETPEGSKRFGSMGEFLRAVVHAGSPGHRVDPRLMENRATGLGEGVNADGGFLVDKDFSQELLTKTYAAAQLASRCRRIQISGPANGLKINAIDETSRADGSRYGAVQAYWAAEAAAATASKPRFRQLELTLKKLIGLCYITDELLSDSVALESVVTDAFVNEFAFKLDDAILNGDGDGKPSGILGSAACAVQAIEAGQDVSTITKENLVKMRSRLWAPARANSVWLVNQAVEPQLNLLTLGDLGAYFPAGSMANQPLDTLFGRPVVAAEQCSALGLEGDVILADLNEYLLIEKGGIKGETSIHVRFLYDELAFRWTYRVDGKPIWSSVLTPYKGSATLSPFVTLGARD